MNRHLFALPVIFPRLRGAILFGAASVLLLLASPGPTAWRMKGRLPPAARTAEQDIRDVLDAQVAAWNKGDLKGFMAGYWSSPKLSFFSGSQSKRGWQATFDRYVERYQAKGQEMGQLRFRDLEIELLSTDSAFVRGRWQLKRSKDSLGGLFTLIFKRLPEGWRIVHDHTSS